MSNDSYWRLVKAGIRPDCAADTIIYYRTHKTEQELEEYVRSVEGHQEVSER